MYISAVPVYMKFDSDIKMLADVGENVGDAAVNTISQPDQTQSLGPYRLQ